MSEIPKYEFKKNSSYDSNWSMNMSYESLSPFEVTIEIVSGRVMYRTKIEIIKYYELDMYFRSNYDENINYRVVMPLKI